MWSRHGEPPDRWTCAARYGPAAVLRVLTLEDQRFGVHCGGDKLGDDGVPGPLFCGEVGRAQVIATAGDGGVVKDREDGERISATVRPR